MKRPRLPSLQHVARLWRPEPLQVKREVIRLIDSTPPLSYEPLYKLMFQIAHFRDSSEQLIKCVERREKREWVKEDFRAILNLAGTHFGNTAFDSVTTVTEQHYGIGRGLKVPFRPPLALRRNGDLVLPWFVFWKKFGLTKEQVSLFVTIAKELMIQSPDLENAHLELWDFGRPDIRAARTLRIISTTDIPIVTPKRLAEMLEVLIDGFDQAVKEILARPQQSPALANRATIERQNDQPDLFD